MGVGIESNPISTAEEVSSNAEEPPGSRRYFNHVNKIDWDDWTWQFKNRIRTSNELEKYLELSIEEKEAFNKGCNLPFSITPYYLSLIPRNDFNNPIRRCMVPTVYEFIKSYGEEEDPLHEEKQSPVEGLVHRYPDRVLLMASDICSCNCRYCTRSRVVGTSKIKENESRLNKAFEYIKSHKEIRDVIISGGDPLLLKDSKLEWILSNIRNIQHVEIIRIGTKVPAVLPQRINKNLLKVLKKYHPLFMSIHFTHPDECTKEVKEACCKLADTGIPLGSQTVLLKGINDNLESIKDLVHKLLMMRVKPYYLYACDPIFGSHHFRADINKGIEIIRGLRGFTSGYAIPNFVIDAPGGGGKIPIMPDYVKEINKKYIEMENYLGNLYKYYI
ncbi:MAG: KamA family radical SAM protein [Nanoarchaeota archaeon]